MNLKRREFAALVLGAAAGMSAAGRAAAQADPLPSWNDGPPKQMILKLVRATTDPSSLDYLPPEERIAEFDQEGRFRREVQPRRQHWFLNEKSGFPFRTLAFCSVSRGQRRLGEKEYRAPSVTQGVALRPRTQGRHSLGRTPRLHASRLLPRALGPSVRRCTIWR
jgi:hypothetical protein